MIIVSESCQEFDLRNWSGLVSSRRVCIVTGVFFWFLIVVQTNNAHNFMDYTVQ